MQVPPSKQLLDAASTGKADVVAALLQSGVSIHTVNESGNKCIHLAAYEGHVNVINVLLDIGEP